MGDPGRRALIGASPQVLVVQTQDQVFDHCASKLDLRRSVMKRSSHSQTQARWHLRVALPSIRESGQQFHHALRSKPTDTAE